MCSVYTSICVRWTFHEFILKVVVVSFTQPGLLMIIVILQDITTKFGNRSERIFVPWFKQRSALNFSDHPQYYSNFPVVYNYNILHFIYDNSFMAGLERFDRVLLVSPNNALSYSNVCNLWDVWVKCVFPVIENQFNAFNA